MEKMTVKELYELLEEQIKWGRGDYIAMTWDINRNDITDIIRDDRNKELYICTGN